MLLKFLKTDLFADTQNLNKLTGSLRGILWWNWENRNHLILLVPLLGRFVVPLKQYSHLSFTLSPLNNFHTTPKIFQLLRSVRYVRILIEYGHLKFYEDLIQSSRLESWRSFSMNILSGCPENFSWMFWLESFYSGSCVPVLYPSPRFLETPLVMICPRSCSGPTRRGDLTMEGNRLISSDLNLTKFNQ